MATQETIKQMFSGGVLRDVEDVTARQAIAALQNAIDALTRGDTTTAIETFQEVIDFLSGVTDDATLVGKLNELRTLINAKYTKPANGIPASDLASGVIPDVSGFATKTEVNAKANSADVYTKSQTDAAIEEAVKNVPTGDIPTKVSELTNDAGYQTQAQVAAAISQAAIEAVVGNGDFVINYDDEYDTFNIVRIVPTLQVTQLSSMSASTKSGTFKVSGTNLKGNVTIAISAPDWTLSDGTNTGQTLTLIPTDGTLAETTITATYSGSTDSVGNTITVSSTNAENKTVTASYTEHQGPTITTSSNPISISEVGGYTNTATLQVTGTLLTGNITAALSSGSKFSLNKNTFVQSGGDVNETLTISFSPLAGDTSPISDTLTLSSDGATPVTIQLTGTVLTQSLTLTPSSLTLEGEAGTAVSGTIKVEGSNVKGDVTIGVPNGFTAKLNGSSVSTLTASQVNAANGVTLTIGNAGTTASGNLTFSVGGTQLASAPLAWREAEVEEVGTVVSRKHGYSSASAESPDVDINFLINKIDGVSGATENAVWVVNMNKDQQTISSNYNIHHLVLPSTIDINGHTYKVVTVASFAFRNCTNLTSVVLGSNVKRVWYHAFESCSKLTSVTWNNTLEEIGDSAFLGCRIGQGDANYSLDLPDTVKVILGGAFQQCPVVKFKVPNGVKCTSFNDITSYFGNFIFAADNTAATYGGSLKEVDLPSGVTYMGGYFHQNNAIEKMTIRSAVVPTWANANSLKLACQNGFDLYVPSNLIANYKTAANWSTYVYDETNNTSGKVIIHAITD